MPRERPNASWLRQVELYLRDKRMSGPASASAMARQRPNVCHRKVDEAMAAPPYASIRD